MENKLKPITNKIIRELNSAKIKVIMVTGDNPLTAISVARTCNIVPPLKNIKLLLGDIVENDHCKELIWTQ